MTLTIRPIRGIGEITSGIDVASAIADAIDDGGATPVQGDIVVVTHKIVSKAEGRIVAIPDEATYRRLVEDEAVEIIRRRGDLVIARTRHGFICANAAVDRSNTAEGTALLLPTDPDRSANTIRIKLERRFGVNLAVIISDTFGRPWRRGLTDVAIGVSGMQPILDLRGTTDAHGRTLDVTEVAVVDELAAAADLVMGKATQIPAAIISGYEWDPHDSDRLEGRISDIIRPANEDLFR